MSSANTPVPQVTPNRLMQMAWAYAPPLAIETAVRLHIFDTLDAGSKTLEEIVSTTQCSTRGLTALLNLLVGLNLLEKSGNNSYGLTPESATFLVSAKPGFQGGIFKHMSQQLMPNWLRLTETVQSGQPAQCVNKNEDGSAFFAQFVEDIFPMSYPSARVLANSLEILKPGVSASVLDLAAGSGVWGIALAQASPNVRVRAVDWKGVLPVTRQVAERFGVADRFTFSPGDLMEADFGTGHQIATLGHILHSEGEQRSRQLLKKTFQALAPGGIVAIAEFLVNEDRTGPVGSLIFAVNMLVQTSVGNTFSFGEIRAWLQEAGFVNARLLDVPGPSPLILADRPSI